MTTTLEMSYRIEFVSSIKTDDISDIICIVESLLGSAHAVSEHCFIGTVSNDSVDLDRIHGILEASGIDIRIGIGRTEALATVALLWSDRNGITYIEVSSEDTYLAGIPVDEIYGISAAKARQMRKFQIYTAYDIKYSNADFITSNLGSDVLNLYYGYNCAVQDNGTTQQWYKRVMATGSEKVSMSKSKTLKNKKVKTESSEVSFLDSLSGDVINLFNYQQATTPL